MIRIESIRVPPRNFDSFVEEVATGLAHLYGPAAAEDYRRKAFAAVQSSLNHPSVRAWAVGGGTPGDPPEAYAMLISARRDGMAHITFVHVLEGFAQKGFEADLVRAAVTDLRSGGVAGISAEPVPLCPLDLDEVFESLEFTKIERQLMMTPLQSKALSGYLLTESVTVDPREYLRVAETIVEAYRDDPGRELHAEVRTLAGADSFVRTAADGAYGPLRPSFLRMMRRAGEPIAAIVGCEAAPGIGFVLQVVVRPDARGQGLGTRLMLELAQCFRDAGLTRMALGVTNANPARRLYERLGFRKILPVNAYVWWQ